MFLGWTTAVPVALFRSHRGQKRSSDSNFYCVVGLWSPPLSFSQFTIDFLLGSGHMPICGVIKALKPEIGAFGHVCSPAEEWKLALGESLKCVLIEISCDLRHTKKKNQWIKTSKWDGTLTIKYRKETTFIWPQSNLPEFCTSLLPDFGTLILKKCKVDFHLKDEL